MEYGLRIEDVSFYVSYKLEIGIYKIVKVITENIRLAFLYVLSIFPCLDFAFLKSQKVPQNFESRFTNKTFMPENNSEQGFFHCKNVSKGSRSYYFPEKKKID